MMERVSLIDDSGRGTITEKDGDHVMVRLDCHSESFILRLDEVRPVTPLEIQHDHVRGLITYWGAVLALVQIGHSEGRAKRMVADWQ